LDWIELAQDGVQANFYEHGNEIPVSIKSENETNACTGGSVRPSVRHDYYFITETTDRILIKFGTARFTLKIFGWI